MRGAGRRRCGYALRVELDHVIWFVPAFSAIEAELTGFTVEAGRRHVGQGTVNRRVFFERSYLEVLWIDEPAVAAASILGFGPRCAGAAGACPFGFVLRGKLSPDTRAAFTSYEVPNSNGFRLQLLTSSLHHHAEPFIAVLESAADQLTARWPAAQQPRAVLEHPCGARHLALAVLTGPTAATSLPSLAPRDVRVRGLARVPVSASARASSASSASSSSSVGACSLELTLTSLTAAATLAGQVHLVPAPPGQAASPRHI